ncbi:MAG: type II toxin-antitoxin system VapC family toxin [Alphaproteobacteria bacterium]|nr:type II toxin-antitoxin system VapC family toxin [Alphaproteobacteria bacterium]
MKTYLDTSIVVALFVDDQHRGRAKAFLRDQQPDIVVSDFAAAEFSAAIARHVRTGKATAQAAKAAFADFDTWAYLFAEGAATDASDVRTAEAFIRRLDLNLRAPDALHIAVVQRIGAILATFDERMAANAKALGTPVAAA